MGKKQTYQMLNLLIADGLTIILYSYINRQTHRPKLIDNNNFDSILSSLFQKTNPSNIYDKHKIQSLINR